MDIRQIHREPVGADVLIICLCLFFFFFSSRRRHTRLQGDWSSDVCSSDLRHSRRARKRLVPVNCAAIPEQLLESEMFGHRKGAFTGADREKMGLLELADGGTLFLDELSEMSMPLQSKMLRVLQDGIVRRVGSEQEDAVVDVRFVSATNRDPRESIRGKLLREDLYYRLNVVQG